MSQDPIRWKDADDAPPRIRRLLRDSGTIPPMPTAVSAAVLARLPSSPVPPVAPPPVAPAKGSFGMPGATLAGTVAVAAVVVAAGVFLMRAESPGPRLPQANAPSVHPAEEVTGPPPMPSSADPASTAEPASSHPLSPSPADTHSAGPNRTMRPTPSASVRGASSVSAPQTGTLREESALIGRARATLIESPTATLAVAEEHARRFPHGELASEREYLRVSALKRLGHVDEARTRARAYLVAYPQSPSAPAVRKLLEELDVP